MAVVSEEEAKAVMALFRGTQDNLCSCELRSQIETVRAMQDRLQLGLPPGQRHPDWGIDVADLERKLMEKCHSSNDHGVCKYIEPQA